MKKLDLFDTKTILYQLATAQALGFATAIVLAEGRSNVTDGIFWMALLRGILFGSAVSFSLARVARDLAGIQKKKAFWIALVAGIVLLIVSPIVMAPGVQSVMPASFLAETWQRWTFSIGLAVAADVAAVAIAATSGRLLTGEQPAWQQPSKPEKQPAAAKQPAPAVSKMARQVPCKWGCGLVASQGKINGHSPHCQKNPARQFVEAAKQ